MFSFIVTVLFAAGIAADLQEIVIDMEDIATSPNYEIFMRSNARNQKTVLIHESQSIVINICLVEDQEFLIKRIAYSTDGWPDQVQVFLDGSLVEEFTTHNGTNWGYLWNEFHFTDAIGSPSTLSPGRHNVQISLDSADQYGVEFDFVTFGFSSSTSSDQILCPEHNIAIQRAIGVQLRETKEVNPPPQTELSNGTVINQTSPIVISKAAEIHNLETEESETTPVTDYVTILNTTNDSNFVVSRLSSNTSAEVDDN